MSRLSSPGFQTPHLPNFPATFPFPLCLLPLLAPSLPNLYNLAFLGTLPWVLFSHSYVLSMQQLPILHLYQQTCHPKVALHVSNVSRSKMKSSSLCSLPPSSIFPSGFCILVNGTFIPPVVRASNLGAVLDTSLLHLNPNTKFEYFC